MDTVKENPPVKKGPALSPTMKNTLISAAVLVAIAVAAVLLLALANAFFPKYVPKLDLTTVGILNSMAPTGVDDATALDENYFVIATPEEKVLSDFNKLNGNASNQVIAVYKAEKGSSAGTVFIETSTAGYKGAANPIVAVTAISADGKFVAMHISKIFEDNYDASDLDKINAALKGKTVVTANDIKPSLTVNAGATAGMTAAGFAKAVSLSIAMKGEIG